MKKLTTKITAFLLAILMLFGTMFISPLQVEAKSELKVSDAGIGILKQMEGFAKYPYYDYSQYTVGYGTYCPPADLERYQKNGITDAEAEELLRNYLINMESGINKFIDKYGLSLSQNQFDSLALFTYNCGSSWMYNDTGIRKAVIDEYKGNEFIYEMSRWCTAGGSILSGLVKRRLVEANMYLNGVYSNTWPSDCRYVRFNGNGGTIGAKVQGFDIDEAVNVKGTATRSGYTFLGWFTASDGGKKVTTLNSSITNNTTLYAQWKDNSVVETPTQPEVEPETPKEEEKTETTTGQKGVVYNCYSLRVRSAASLNSTTVAYLKAGDVVEILEQKEADGRTWGRISKGWVSLNCIKLDATATPPIEEKPVETPVQPETPREETIQKTQTGKVVNCWTLNVRESAGISSKKIGFLLVRTKVTIYETKIVGGETWGKCDKGWICMDYVKLDEVKEETAKPESTTKPSTSETTQTTQTVKTGTVINCSVLTIRKDAGRKNKATGWYKAGTQVNIYETKEADGKTWGKTEKGWISLSCVKLDEFKAFTGTVTASSLRVRQSANLSADTVGYIYKGKNVTIIEVKTADGMQWGKIDNGWISLNYVSY